MKKRNLIKELKIVILFTGVILTLIFRYNIPETVRLYKKLKMILKGISLNCGRH